MDNQKNYFCYIFPITEKHISYIFSIPTKKPKKSVFCLVTYSQYRKWLLHFSIPKQKTEKHEKTFFLTFSLYRDQALKNVFFCYISLYKNPNGQAKIFFFLHFLNTKTDNQKLYFFVTFLYTKSKMDNQNYFFCYIFLITKEKKKRKKFV